MKKKIFGIEENSISWEVGIEPGDFLISINGRSIRDMFDYNDLVLNNEFLEVMIEKETGDEYVYEIEKDYYEDLGIIFESSLMDESRRCTNKCIFCFIDQLPKNMRETLYFKDDDYRLSFLQGNYVTLTNLEREELERIIKLRFSPINISVHSTDPELRAKMMKNPKAAEIMTQIKKIADARLMMNFQIVLVPSVNDGEKLDEAIGELASFFPYANSLSIVPIGLTQFREHLKFLRVFTKCEAEDIIELVENRQNELLAKFGSRFVYLADEFYLMAEHVLPEAETYQDYPQLENGVGMLRLMIDEFIEAINESSDPCGHGRIGIVTGYAAYDIISNLADMMMKRHTGICIEIYPIANDFFGRTITVSGLITGSDIEKQLSSLKLPDTLLIPKNMMKFGDNVFLDGYSVCDLEKKLHVRFLITETTGRGLFENIVKGVNKWQNRL